MSIPVTEYYILHITILAPDDKEMEQHIVYKTKAICTIAAKTFVQNCLNNGRTITFLKQEEVLVNNNTVNNNKE